MNWRNIGLIFRREVLDQLRDRRTLFMIAVLPLLLYPALGIGMMQLTVLFSEQPRTVVILGAGDLPPPALIEGDRFLDTWFRIPSDADKLQVITDDQAADAQDLTRTAWRTALLEEARRLRELIDQREVVSAQLAEAEKAGDLPAIATLRQKLDQLTEALGDQFHASDIQVLIVIPPDFARHLAAMKQAVVERGDKAAEFDYPRPLIVQNSADEKSLIAANRVQRVMDAWEREILKQALQEVGLPASLPAPINAAAIDLAEDQQLSANVWSKLFPALLVIMALTGAFYPAIDLAAGEKERGTMETLLICPAARTEIVLGKFLTVMLFSASTALLNLMSLGFTGKYMVSLAGGGPMAKVGDLTLPPLSALTWVLVILVPLSALFSALCLAFATFARSSKEGQYYLTPLLMVTLGLTVFCLSPAVEIQPFYSVMPVMGPALLLKGLLLGNSPAPLLVYVLPVLATSFGYSVLALWWAIDQFGSEDVLFREAERFDLRLWLRHLLRDKEPTPSFAEAGFCFVLIMFLQFVALKFFQAPLQSAAEEDRGRLMMQLLIIQQLVIVGTPPLFMGVLLTSSIRETFRLRWPNAADLLAAGLLAVALHPLSLEFAARISWFFPPLPESVTEVMATIASGDLPWWIPFLAFAVAPAVCEELAFRGFLLSGFVRGGREKLAIVLSALTFGIMHLIPQQVLNASLLGLVLGLIAVRSRSLWPGVLFHLVYNGLELGRNRWGGELPTAGPWGWLFQFSKETGGLRYQPLLLMLMGLAACVLIGVIVRPRETLVEPPFRTEPVTNAGPPVLAPRQ
uniref:CPBP family intramembrane metalloprotease n=1 Tax=Schlesneria paludicola TaxID=360056 RepID=A0A7C2JY58_9PLAN